MYIHIHVLADCLFVVSTSQKNPIYRCCFFLNKETKTAVNSHSLWTVARPSICKYLLGEEGSWLYKYRLIDCQLGSSGIHRRVQSCSTTFRAQKRSIKKIVCTSIVHVKCSTLYTQFASIFLLIDIQAIVFSASSHVCMLYIC